MTDKDQEMLWAVWWNINEEILSRPIAVSVGIQNIRLKTSSRVQKRPEEQTGCVVRVSGRDRETVDLLKHEKKYWFNTHAFDAGEVTGTPL